MREYTTKLLRGADLSDDLMISEAFEKVSRADFLPEGIRSKANLDQALPIGYGQTNSQPSTVVFMLSLLAPKVGEKVLDVGFGSGWTTALLARIVGSSGKVVGLEVNKQVFDFGKQNLKKYRFKNIKLYHATAWKDFPGTDVFDKILVSAASKTIPRKLLDRLKVGGRLLIPLVDKRSVGLSHELTIVDKKAKNQYLKKSYPGFVFVPLIK